jgi:hypothetical protein
MDYRMTPDDFRAARYLYDVVAQTLAQSGPSPIRQNSNKERNGMVEKNSKYSSTTPSAATPVITKKKSLELIAERSLAIQRSRQLHTSE